MYVYTHRSLPKKVSDNKKTKLGFLLEADELTSLMQTFFVV